jgi:hypothetical protein
MKRRSPPFALLLAIAAFVFAQLMGAVHACNMGLDGTAPAKAAVATQGDGGCCDDGQAPPDAACDNHCQQAYKAPERVNIGTAVPIVVPGIAMPVALMRKADPAPRSFLPAPGLAWHTEPSISIRNCCFRI